MTSDAQSTGPRHRAGNTERPAEASVAALGGVAAPDRSRQHAVFTTDKLSQRRDAAPVICAELLLHHGLTDPAILSHLARTWQLDEPELRAALAAAHILLRRQEPHHHAGANEYARARWHSTSSARVRLRTSDQIAMAAPQNPTGALSARQELAAALELGIEQRGLARVVSTSRGVVIRPPDTHGSACSLESAGRAAADAGQVPSDRRRNRDHRQTWSLDAQPRSS